MKREKSNRAPFAPRRFIVSDTTIRDRAAAALANMPVDPLRPLEVVIREAPKARKLDQNALMHAGPLRDLEEQAWLEGRQFSAATWHYFAKKEFLPEDFDPELCLEGYRKWDFDPSGERILVGSTTQLTVHGFSDYLEQLYAFGAGLGVQFRPSPNEGRA